MSRYPSKVSLMVVLLVWWPTRAEAMIELLPVFFATVAGGAIFVAAALSALAKLLLRRFARRIFSFSLPLLIGVTVAEALIMFTALCSLVSQIEPRIPSPENPPAHLLLRLSFATTFIHVFLASFPNLLLVHKEAQRWPSGGGSFQHIQWAVMLSLFTPAFLALETLMVWALFAFGD
ncbi:MAG: hypothetical protein AB1646_00075 [Thermodesulfobacteriota bacterium]